MKKQIAILATIIAASGFSAFGQDWITLADTSTHQIWDLTGLNGGTTAGIGGYPTLGNFDITVLWAASGTSDPLAAIGQTANLSVSGSSAATSLGNTSEVATNGAVSTASALSTISTMLSGGWTIANNESSGSGSAATGLAITTVSSSGKFTSYNAGSPFELVGGTGVSDSQIELIVIAWNASATLGSGSSTFSSVSAFGYSDAFNDTVGGGSTDPFGGTSENGAGMNQFGVAPVPEPTTLALAGLGGLSMLFLRRRKA